MYVCWSVQNFVSNKTSAVGDARVDPVETLRYSIFVATSERMRAVDMATILNVNLKDLKV